MLMSRHYDWEAPREAWTTRVEGCPRCQQKKVVVNGRGTGVEPCPTCHGTGVMQTPVPPLDHVEIRHTGHSQQQSFSTGLIIAGTTEGWIRVDAKTITLATRPDKLVYRIDAEPGRYCCHCKAKLQDDVTGELARLHVATEHPGAPSPDPTCPAGYAKVNAYLCTLDADAHARWSLSTSPEGHLMQAGKRWKGGRTIG